MQRGSGAADQTRVVGCTATTTWGPWWRFLEHTRVHPIIYPHTLISKRMTHARTHTLYRSKVGFPWSTNVPAPNRHVFLAENTAAGGTREGEKIVQAAAGVRAQLRSEFGHPSSLVSRVCLSGAHRDWGAERSELRGACRQYISYGTWRYLAPGLSHLPPQLQRITGRVLMLWVSGYYEYRKKGSV